LNPLNTTRFHPSSQPSSSLDEIESLLTSFGHFGVDLSLDRIVRLLAALENPHRRVPIIHVAGTNGKGSVCAYVSSILIAAGYRVGRYTSPHLVDWTERLCINNQPIHPENLLAILKQIQAAIAPDSPSPTQFEVITAAAWLYLAQQRVDLAVIEVGLGGRLDATNVCDRPLVSVITSISRDHWQRLGPTLADIAGEKAGILKPHCPAVIGQLPGEAEPIFRAKLAALSCPAHWVSPAQETAPGYAQVVLPDSHSQIPECSTLTSEDSPQLSVISYPLPLPGSHQLMNSALAIATILELRNQGWAVGDEAILQGMAQTQWLGRIQWVSWQGKDLLIDGAHNEAAAVVLRGYIDQSDRLSKPVHWVIGMLSTKDHQEIFEALLRPGDSLSLVPVPDHSSANPQELAAIAQQVCDRLNDCRTYSDLFTALTYAFQPGSPNPKDAAPTPSAVILCGSLYLIGFFLKQLRLHS